ncbi:MAG: dihydropyrimidinase [Treponema sp.]|jgi:dihydropyrimidinase|nr:dihydropyrimidinase [Treponema sp.]
MESILIKNGTLVSSGREWKSDLLVENGRIAAIAENLSATAAQKVIEAGGCYVFPGFVDAHTHLDMGTGSTVTADDFESGTAAALAGGTTTIVDYATQDKGQTLLQALAVWHKKADGKSSCNYGFHMAVTDWKPEKSGSPNADTPLQLRQIVDEGVSSLKVYMAYDNLRLSDREIYEVLCQAKDLGLVVCNHCENGDLINELIAKNKAAGRLSPAAHPLSHPDDVEAEAVARYLYLAHLADVPVNIVHLSTKKGLEEVRLARSRGQKFYVESCPHYLTLTDAVYRLPDFESAKYVCSPPMRSSADVESLWEGVSGTSSVGKNCGDIQTIATDHCSFNFAGQKELGRSDFSKIPNGMPGIEHRPAVMFTAGNVGAQIEMPHHLSAARFSALMGENSARIFGLYPERGVLQEGAVADITVWDPAAAWTITAADQIQRVDYTPYEGMKVTGRAAYVMLNGEICARNGKIVKKNSGRYIRRHTGFAEFR